MTKTDEWFEFEEHRLHNKNNTVANQLNELSETHEIIEVHYASFSSSDWNVLAGGTTVVLVRACKKEVAE
ncbi:hypothetical protein ACSDIK_05015 [Listeria monocytogenes]|uniref:hypothetical protein n=1 Tax=Listeria monocytogenes TaxID=1639 RepID=UPI000874AFD4|nr:hypothetical protein [Listeria monocytogenes]EAC6494460.1 hypothetical protein [Listeria monocytogenes]EAC9095062.1 hypothetical protein [Listeria monocytogenes]EAD5227413.1 hypothetical protein [Listeria monocytogenes]EAD5271146.1 hypothetical protein [Listeria monocytogenes]EAD8962187.1 hypothetical protein [Listeria monocytogenes]